MSDKENQFMEVTGRSRLEARRFLQIANGNLEVWKYIFEGFIYLLFNLIK